MLVHLTTLVSRHDYRGAVAECKSVVHARAVRDRSHLALADECWDVGCEYS
jgi:hypothetical protein